MPSSPFTSNSTDLPNPSLLQLLESKPAPSSTTSAPLVERQPASSSTLFASPPPSFSPHQNDIIYESDIRAFDEHQAVDFSTIAARRWFGGPKGWGEGGKMNDDAKTRDEGQVGGRKVGGGGMGGKKVGGGGADMETMVVEFRALSITITTNSSSSSPSSVEAQALLDYASDTWAVNGGRGWSSFSDDGGSAGTTRGSLCVLPHQLRPS